MDVERRERHDDTLTLRIRRVERLEAEAAARRVGVSVSEFARAALRSATRSVWAGQDQ